MQSTDVSCAIIVREGMVLAANRNASVSNCGMWEFPGGKPKVGEDPKECVRRRVQEELNVKIDIVGEIQPYRVSVSREKEYNIYPFFAEIVDGSVELINHTRAEWFMPMQLMSLGWPQTDLPIIEEIVGRIFSKGRII